MVNCKFCTGIGYIPSLDPEKEMLICWPCTHKIIKAKEEKMDKLEILEKKYYELIMEVGNKYEGETRHQTALRYIRQAERGNNKTYTDKKPK